MPAGSNSQAFVAYAGSESLAADCGQPAVLRQASGKPVIRLGEKMVNDITILRGPGRRPDFLDPEGDPLPSDRCTHCPGSHTGARPCLATATAKTRAWLLIEHPGPWPGPLEAPP